MIGSASGWLAPADWGWGASRADAVLGFFSDPTIGRIERDFAGSPRVAERVAELRRYESVLGDLGFADFVEFDFSIVRGLAYYTGIVFEIFDRAGRFRAICGGGRYDRLMEHVGGDRLSAVGFGMGDVVLGEVVRARGLPPEYRPGVDYYIISISPAEAPLARRIAGVQRREGRSVVYALGGKSVKKQFSSAAALGAGSVIVLGPDEVERGGCGCEGDGERAGARDPDRRADRPGFGAGARRRHFVPPEHGFEGTREEVERAIRRLSAFEYVILAASFALALGGGGVAAYLLSAGTRLPFRLTWAVISMGLLIIPGLFVFGRDYLAGRVENQPTADGGTEDR